VLAAWVYLLGTDTWWSEERRGLVHVFSTGGVVRVHQEHQSKLIDRTVVALRQTPPDSMILDMTASPMLFVLADRLGHGALDTVMPGVFLEPDEEKRFLAQLQASPPSLVVWSDVPFDRMEERDKHTYAPLVTDWVLEHYPRPPWPWDRMPRWYVRLPSDPVGGDAGR
jgi:hypothetical protein